MLRHRTSTRDLARARAPLASVAAAVLIAACGGGGGGGGGGGATTAPMTGTVSAPGGTIALAPKGLKRFFAEIFGREAMAALPGLAPVPNVPVALIQIDGNGSKVADVTSTTADGNGAFTLNVPNTLVPGPQYVIRATGAAALDRMVSGFASQDVDPATQATESLVLQQLSGGSVLGLQSTQVAELGNQVAALIVNIDPSGKGAEALATALATAAKADEAVNNSVGNLTQVYGVAGTVTDGNGVPLAGIKVVVLDFNQWVVRARAVTDANGSYNANVATGDYIVGAMNFTTTSTAASEWWTCNTDPSPQSPCGASNQFSAAKVTVGATTVPVNFKLEPGARIQGTISASDTQAGLQGVQVAIRDFIADEPAAFEDAQIGGAYCVNVRPGTYTVGARNKTLLTAYSSGIYNGPAVLAGGTGTATNGGGTFAATATPVVVAAGSTYTFNLPLVPGGLVSGQVTDPLASNSAVAGMPVRFYLLNALPNDVVGTFVEGLRTDNAGNYALWVRPTNTYAVRSRGQTTQVASLTPSGATVNFAAAVGRVTGKLLAPDSSPLSQVKVEMYETVTANNVFQDLQVTNGDGSFEVFMQPTGDYIVDYKVDNGSTKVGSAIHDGTSTPQGMQLISGTPVHFDATTETPLALNTLTLPAGGELHGVVTLTGALAANILVQVRIATGNPGSLRFLTTRTSSDGSWSLSLPAATYGRVCAFVAGTLNPCPTTASSAGVFASIQSVVVQANQSNNAGTIAIP